VQVPRLFHAPNEIPLLVLQVTKAGQRPGNEAYVTDTNCEVQHCRNSEQSKEYKLLRFWREHVHSLIAPVVAAQKSILAPRFNLGS